MTGKVTRADAGENQGTPPEDHRKGDQTKHTENRARRGTKERNHHRDSEATQIQTQKYTAAQQPQPASKQEEQAATTTQEH